MSKRVKITFESVNEGKIIPIDPALLAASEKRIKEAMTPIVRKFKRDQVLSARHARELILNA